MNTFRQHVPNFVEGRTPVHISFNTTEELLGNKFIQDQKDWFGPGSFYRFSKTHDGLLMGESNGGRSWWALGYVDCVLDLPDWEPVRDSK